MCQEILETYLPTMYPILVAGEVSPRGICNLIGACPDTITTQDESALAAHRTRRKPFASAKKRHASDAGKPPVRVRGKSVLNFMHVSDVHLDTLYVVGSNENCKEPLV